MEQAQKISGSVAIVGKTCSRCVKPESTRSSFIGRKNSTITARDILKNAEISLLDTVVLWEKVYGPQIEQLENRVIKLSEGDFMGRSCLNQLHVAERLEIQESSWNDAANEWFSSEEEAAFKLAPKRGWLQLTTCGVYLTIKLYQKVVETSLSSYLFCLRMISSFLSVLLFQYVKETFWVFLLGRFGSRRISTACTASVVL